MPDIQPDRVENLAGTAMLGPIDAYLRRQQFGKKLALAFGLLLALAALAAAIAIQGVWTVQNYSQQTMPPALRIRAIVADAHVQLLHARLSEREFMLSWREQGLAASGTRYLDARKFIDASKPRSNWGAVEARPTHADRMDVLVKRLKGVAAPMAELRAAVADEDGDDADDLRRNLASLTDSLPELNRRQRHYARLLGQTVELLQTRGHVRQAPGAEVEERGHIGDLRRLGRSMEGQLYPSGLPAPVTQAVHARPGIILALLSLRRAEKDYLLRHRQQDRIAGSLQDDPDDTDTPRPLIDDCAAVEQDPPAPDPGTAEATDVLDAVNGLVRSVSSLPPTEMARARVQVVAYRDAFKALRSTDRKLHRLQRKLGCAGWQLDKGLVDWAEDAPEVVDGVRALASNAAAETVGRVVLFAILLLAVGAALAFKLARDIRVPVSELAETANKVAGGDLRSRAAVYSDDEIGQLADTFNTMTARLARQKAQIAAQMQEIEHERDRSEKLLLNILPRPIAERLKQKEHPIADAFDEASVLFADVVGYTRLASRLDPRQVVERLSQIFTAFDEIAAREGIEKIKTIGDAYMAAAGLPLHAPDHAARIARMALGMQQALARINADLPEPLQLRIGLNTGPVVAGVIGDQKFLYDLWGDAVNVASRMESHGEPGAIHVTEAFRASLPAEFQCEPRGEIEVKGKGIMSTWWLVGVDS